jgi:hypothetical protein
MRVQPSQDHARRSTPWLSFVASVIGRAAAIQASVVTRPPHGMVARRPVYGLMCARSRPRLPYYALPGGVYSLLCAKE